MKNLTLTILILLFSAIYLNSPKVYHTKTAPRTLTANCTSSIKNNNPGRFSYVAKKRHSPGSKCNRPKLTGNQKTNNISDKHYKSNALSFQNNGIC